MQGHINNNNACFSSHQCTILYYSILCYPVKERKKERTLWLLSLCLSVAGRLWFRFLFLTLLSLCALNSVRTNSNYGDGGECELSFALGWWLYTPLSFSFSSYLYLSSFFFFFFFYSFLTLTCLDRPCTCNCACSYWVTGSANLGYSPGSARAHLLN